MLSPLLLALLLMPAACGAAWSPVSIPGEGDRGPSIVPLHLAPLWGPGTGTGAGASSPAPPPGVQSHIYRMTREVSKEYLKYYLTTLQEFGTRFCAAPQMARATKWLHDALEGNGRIQAAYHNFTYQGQVNSYLMSNVVLTLPGANLSSDRVYYMYAHSDSVSEDYWSNAPGADDDGSGCVAVLEAARILSRHTFQDTIRFAFFTAEEIGLVGSGRYVQSIYSSGENVQGGICYDMVGTSYTGGTYDFNLAWDPASAWQGQHMVGANERYGIGLRIATYQYPPGQGAPTDVTRFWQRGYPGVFGIEEDFSPYYHSTRDRVEYINFTLVQRATMLAVASLAEMARLLYVDVSVGPGGFRLSSERPVEGEDVGLTVNITNTGNLNATGLEVRFCADGLPLVSKRVDVPANGTASAEATWRAAAGTHRISVELDPGDELVETDESNNTAEVHVDVNDRPRAVLAVAPLTLLTGEEARFDGANSVDLLGGVVEYRFDFGDGLSTGWTPSPAALHAYVDDGPYTASLTVRDAAGSMSLPSLVNLTVLNRAPFASPSSNLTRALTLVPIQFISGASDAEGPVLTRWSFGDGCETDESDPVHAYSRSGSYTVALNVTDMDGAFSTYHIGVIIDDRPPVCWIEPSVEEGDINTEFTFAAGTADMDGRVVALRWELGDGETDPRPGVSHYYWKPGWYTVRLSVWDDDGAEASSSLLIHVIDRRPLARGSARPAETTTFSPVLFFGGDSSDIEGGLSYIWDFGDGNTSLMESPRHAYTSPGTYAPSLTVRDEAGQTSTFHLDPVRVLNRPPLARFRVFGNFTLGGSVYFDATASSDPEGPIVIYWSFGDGEHAGGPVAEHIFPAERSYTVELTVADEEGELAKASLVIAIEPPPPPPPEGPAAPESPDTLETALGALSAVLLLLLVGAVLWGARWRGRAREPETIEMEDATEPYRALEAEPLPSAPAGEPAPQRGPAEPSAAQPVTSLHDIPDAPERR
ncbi:MAG: M20/M25/M40 family metallo-hydrolase [Thermoplasmatota archaeon]